MDLRNNIKKLFEGNIFEAPETQDELEPLDFGFDPSDTSHDVEIGLDEPEDVTEPETPPTEKKVLRTSGVPSGAKPPMFMGKPVEYDLSDETKYKRAVAKKGAINKKYSAVKRFIQNYYLRKLQSYVDPQQMQIELTQNDPDAIPFTDALIQNFRLMNGYKDEGANPEDIIRDMVSVDLDQLIADKRQNPSMVDLQRWLDELGIDGQTFKRNLSDDLVALLMKSSHAGMRDLLDKFEKSKAVQKRSAESNIVKKARQKVEAANSELATLVKNLPPEFKKGHRQDYDRFERFVNKIPDKIEKIRQKYINTRKDGDYSEAVERFKGLLQSINQNIQLLSAVAPVA